MQSDAIILSSQMAWKYDVVSEPLPFGLTPKQFYVFWEILILNGLQ